MPAPNALLVYTIVLLAHQQHYLLLNRAATKRFAPGRWTGIGGAVEPNEYGDLRAGALRELYEETGIGAGDVHRFLFRRVVLHARPGSPVTLLLYFTGLIGARPAPSSSAGTLEWVTADQLDELDVIETTRPVLPLLIADQQRDPLGQERLHLGIARYENDGAMTELVWV